MLLDLEVSLAECLMALNNTPWPYMHSRVHIQQYNNIHLSDSQPSFVVSTQKRTVIHFSPPGSVDQHIGFEIKQP